MASEQTLQLLERNRRDVPVTITRNGAAVNLTGYTIEFIVKRRTTDSAALARYVSTDASVAVPDPATGRIIVLLDGEDFTPGTYPYHLDIISGAGRRETVLYGYLQVVDL